MQFEDIKTPDLVEVQFKSRYKKDEFGGNAYTYIADVPLQVGDIVKAPTKFGESEARVCRVDVPVTDLHCRVGELRHITEPGTPGGNLFHGFFD